MTGPGRVPPSPGCGALYGLVGQQVRRPVGGRHDGPQGQLVLGRGVIGPERDRDDLGAGRQVPGGGLHGADQGVGADHDLRGARHHGQQQHPGLQLAGRVPELADLVAVQRRVGDVGQDRGARELLPHLGGRAPQVPEGAVLGRPVRGHRAAQPDQVRDGRQAVGDLEHRERGALRVLQQQPGRVRLDGAGRHLQGHRDRPGGPVRQPAFRRDRVHLGGRHEPAQRRQGPGQQQLQIPELALVQGPRGQARYVRGQPGGRLSGHVHLRPAPRPPGAGSSKAVPIRQAPRGYTRSRCGQARSRVPRSSGRPRREHARGSVQRIRAKRFSGLRMT